MSKTFSIFIFLGIFFLGGCTSNPAPSKVPITFTGNAMTIDYKIMIGKTLSPKQKRQVQEAVDATFNETDRIYNKWNPHSEISKLNSLKAGIQIPISKELERLLILTQEIVFLTDGRFDPTIEPLQRLWKKAFENKQIPSQNEIHTLVPAIGWDKIHLEAGFFSKDHKETQIDLGGIAKGYCIDLIAERLNNLGFQDFFVEWGGEIRASGSHPEGRPWNIFISHLGDHCPAHAIATLSLHDEAIATSGDYLQNWSVFSDSSTEGSKWTTYSHIIDAKTFEPLKIHPFSIASASVVAPTCTLADGLATALMLFPSKKEAMEWAENLKKTYPKLAFWIISRSE